MSNHATPTPSIDYAKLLWEFASSLSESAQSAAVKKVRELGYDENQGEIPLEETLMNLSGVRDVLIDTVETGRLPQLPFDFKLGYSRSPIESAKALLIW